MILPPCFKTSFSITVSWIIVAHPKTGSIPVQFEIRSMLVSASLCTVLCQQGDVYFTSTSNMVLTHSCKTPTSARSFTHLPSKLPKNFDKRDLTTSGRFSESEEAIYIYKISMENMTGRRDFESSCTVPSSTTSLRNSSSDESVCKTEGISIISDEGNSDGSAHRLDFIHPILGDEETPLVETSFQEDSSPVNSLRRKGRVAHLTSSPRDSEEESPVNSLRRKGRANLNPSPRDSEDESPVNSLRRKVHNVHFSPSHSPFHDVGGIPNLPAGIEKELNMFPTRHGSVESHPSNTPTGSASGSSIAFQVEPPHKNKLSAAHSCSKLRRRKVITSRKSLDAGSRWLYPYFNPADDRLSSDPMKSGRGSHDTPEILGQLENVVYSSPDSGIHDLSLSSNYSDTSSNLTGGGGGPHH